MAVFWLIIIKLLKHEHLRFVLTDFLLRAKLSERVDSKKKLRENVALRNPLYSCPHKACSKSSTIIFLKIYLSQKLSYCPNFNFKNSYNCFIAHLLIAGQLDDAYRLVKLVDGRKIHEGKPHIGWGALRPTLGCLGNRAKVLVKHQHIVYSVLLFTYVSMDYFLGYRETRHDGSRRLW